MKKITIIIACLVSISAVLFTTACNDVFNVVTDLTTSRLFRPINFAASLNKTQATISWVSVNNAVSYTLQISLDSLNYTKPLVDTTTTKLSFVQEFAGSTKYYARIKANAADTVKNSKFNAELSFKTPSENLFDGYGTSNNTGKIYSAYMNDVKTLDIKWAPNMNVTHLILLSSDGSSKDSVLISPAEAVAGEKIVRSLTNSNWSVSIFNNKISRGKTTGVVEGDVILNSGGDLLTAMTNATSGQVIVLAPGTNFTIGSSAYNFNKNIKLRSLSASNRSVICMTGGTPTATSNMFGFAAASAIDSLVFENIDFTGYCDNSTASVKIGYLFSNKVASTVTDLKFINCSMHNFGNTTIRLSGGTGQTITNLLFKGCIINEIGFASPYALVNTNSADYVTNITFSNCTVYNFKASIVLRTGAYTMGSVNLTNCTFNQTTQDTAIRYVMDLNGMTITNGVNVKNCIFGSSGSMTAGIRASGVLAITGTYYTSDFFDETPVGTPPVSISRKALMTAYPGASTSLWSDPVAGNFTLKDASFAGKKVAGDPRWY